MSDIQEKRIIEGVEVTVKEDTYEELQNFLQEAETFMNGKVSEEAAEEAEEAVGEAAGEAAGEQEKSERELFIEQKMSERANQTAGVALSIIDQYQGQIAELEEKFYIFHGARMICSCGSRMARLVVPRGHGAQIHDTPQMVDDDCRSETNVMCFGNCMSAENPLMMVAAQEAVSRYRENHKFMDFCAKVNDFFSGKETYQITNEFLEQCICECIPCFSEETKWLDCREENLIDGKPSLLISSSLNCIHGGHITICSLGVGE